MKQNTNTGPAQSIPHSPATPRHIQKPRTLSTHVIIDGGTRQGVSHSVAF